MTDVQEPFAVAALVAGELERIGVDYTIGGSLAASFAGEPRTTIDVDFVAAIESAQVPALAAALATEFYVDLVALERAVQQRSRVDIVHEATNIKVDIFIAGGTPLDHQQLRRRLKVEVAPGVMLFVHPPEDILLQKLRWFRLGGEVSDRQWRDIRGIVRVQGTRLDRDYLTANALVLGVADLLERLLNAERPE
jgi:hypothetical protein